MVGIYGSRGTEENRGGYRGENGRGFTSRRAQERQEKIADRDQERKAAEAAKDMFDASCLNASKVMRQVYRVTDPVGITKPKVRIQRYVEELDDAILDTYEVIGYAEEALKKAEENFNLEREEKLRIKNTYVKAKAILKELETERDKLKTEKKELTDKLIDMRESEENAGEWAETEGKHKERDNELRGLEKDIDDHKEDMSQLERDMVYTQNRYIIEKKNKITYKNNLTKLRKTRDNLEYIRATLEPYLLEDSQTGEKAITIGSERANELIENGKKIIVAQDKLERAKARNKSESEDKDLNFEDLERHMPEEIGRNEESKLKDRFNKIMEDMEEDD